MSALIHLAQQVSTQALAVHPMAAPMAGGDGILDWLTVKNTEVQTLLRGVAVTLGILFVIWQAVASRGAVARIIVALIASGVFVWGAWSVTNIKDRVDSETKTKAAVMHVEPGPTALDAAAHNLTVQ